MHQRERLCFSVPDNCLSHASNAQQPGGSSRQLSACTAGFCIAPRTRVTGCRPEILPSIIGGRCHKYHFCRDKHCSCRDKSCVCYLRELYQKQHHSRSRRLPTQRKNGGGIHVYATWARRRERVFGDRTHPLEEYNDDLVDKKFRFHRQFISELAEEVSQDIQFSLPRKGSLTLVLQMCLALRFYAAGSFHWFQSVVGELIGVDQSTACRTITTVTDALMLRVRDWIKMPTQAEANRQKQKFYAMRATPGVIGCIDGTHIRMQGPNQQDHEFVNRKNYRSINVQVRQFCFTIQSA